MKILILAAGYGIRLYPYTRNFPKPLLKIDKKPIINYLLDRIKELDNISSIVVVTNSRFFNHFKAWKETLKIKFPICIINDLTTGPQNKLGAIGDMHFVFSREGFSEDYLVLGGDNFFKGSLLDFINFAKKKHPSVTIGLFDIKDKQKAHQFGVVSLDKKSRIVKFWEKPNRPKSSLVAMCLYYFPQTKLRLIEEYLKDPWNSRDTAGNYIHWLSRRQEVYGFKFSDLWFDIGNIYTYREVKRARRRKGVE